MAICSNAQMLGRLIDDFIKQYETLLNDDTLSDVESAETSEILEELYAQRKAIQEEDLDFVESYGFVKNLNTTRSEVLTRTFKEVLGDRFSFTYSGSKTPKLGTLLSAEATEGGISIKFVENNRVKRYSFSYTSGGRSHNTKSGKSYINLPGIRKVLDNYHLNMEVTEQMEIIFGSNESNIKLSDKYRQKDYIHGSVDHMKTTLKKLHILGGEKASQEDLDKYLGLLDKMSPEFFNKLELYINEEADKSEGVYRAKRIDIEVNSAPRAKGNQQSEASIYMEEVIHSMTAAAIHSNTIQSRKLKRQLANFIETARKQITWRNFLPKESIDPAAEESYAKWLHNYIFEGKNADYEFIAKAIAVPEVAEALKYVKVQEVTGKKRILERINDFIAMILDVLQGNITLEQKNQNVHEALTNLAFRFGELNTKANNTIAEQKNFLTPVVDLVNHMDDKVRVKIDSLIKTHLSDAMQKDLQKEPTTFYGKVKRVGEFIALSMINPTYTKAMGAIATAWGLPPESSLREAIGGLFASDTAQRAAEFLVMQSGYVDKKRNNQIDLTRKSTLRKFTDPSKVTRTEEEALTSVLSDTDLAALFGKDSVAREGDISSTRYDNKTIRELLTDDKTLDQFIKNTKRALKDLDGTHYYWHSNQAVGLGIYMATHQGTPEQNLNAHNIARGIHSSHRKRPNQQVVRAIDELASLVAIKNTDKEQRAAVANLMKTEWTGVQHVADVIEGFKRNSDATVFKNNRITNKIKGYSREVFDDSIMMEVAPLEDKEKMEQQGFQFKATLAPRAGDVRNKPMALYITASATRPDRLRGSVRLNQVRAKGTSVTDLAYMDGEGFSNNVIRERAQRDINKIEREALERAKKMEAGEYDFKDTVFGVTAVINDDGKVTDYRYMMDKATKKKLLKQDTRISEVMARSFGTILDKDLSAQHNTKVLEVLREDMVENWTAGTKGKDGLTDYVEIGPKAADPEMRKLYYMLPREFQEFIQNRDDKTLAVRRDLYQMAFGYSHISIADFPGLKSITPRVLLNVIRFAENMWIDMIKIVKSQILIKMPTILLSNLFSNIIQATMRGYNPLTVLKMYGESYRDISKYNVNIKRIQELENEQTSLTVALEKDTTSPQRRRSIASQLKRGKGELEALKRRLEDSPIHELVQLGLDQNVEDITNDTDRDANRITGYLDEQLKKAPEIVRDGADILFITKRTKFYKVANEFLETSDLVARDVQNRIESKKERQQVDGKSALPGWWLDKQDDNYAPKQRLTGKEREVFLEEAKKQRYYDLVEDYINYAKPSGRMEEYLNRVGILMFTKYVKRIQRIIAKTGGRGPIKALIGLLGVSYLGGLPSIHEQSFLAKDWYTDSIGPGNVFPIYSPIENFMTFITPALLKSSTYDVSL